MGIESRLCCIDLLSAELKLMGCIVRIRGNDRPVLKDDNIVACIALLKLFAAYLLLSDLIKANASRALNRKLCEDSQSCICEVLYDAVCIS